MSLSVFCDAPINLERLQASILAAASSREIAACVRAWLLSRPRFGEFEGLSRFLERANQEIGLGNKLKVEKWAVVGGYTTRPVAAVLRACLLAEGVFGDVFESNYNAFDIEILKSETPLVDFQPGDVLVCTGHANLNILPGILASDEEIRESKGRVLTYFADRWNSIRTFTGARIHQHNFDFPAIKCLGRLEHGCRWSATRFIEELNQSLWEANAKEIFVVDVAGIQQRVGSETWWSPKWYHHGKLGFNPECAGDYARLLHSHISATRGTSRRCLVLDLDNTLWGGVVGDQGVFGVAFGSGEAAGEAHVAFCHYLKRLAASGVILAVVSKNDLAIAQSMFLEHPEMPLELDDFAAFKANWQPKSENLRDIAHQLNIGLDSMVFVDDDPAECRQVSHELPDVVVLQAKGETCNLAEELDRLQLFDRAAFTSEDAGRNASYQGRRLIEAKKRENGDLRAFLSDLVMVGECRLISEGQTTRVAQLFAKTNQFNLTKETFMEKDLAKMREGTRYACYACQLSDRYASHGVVSAVVLERRNHEVDIRNWVMSCRVFNRTVEEFMLLEIVNQLQKSGAQILTATVHLQEKNRYVHGLFDRLGFHLASESERIRRYLLDLNSPLTAATQVQTTATTTN